jgi:uncharacterized phage protein gp47/JayE
VLLSDITPLVTATLSAYFGSLKPGDTVIYSRLINLITSISGVIDVTLTAPSANIVTLADAAHMQMPVLGTVALS